MGVKVLVKVLQNGVLGWLPEYMTEGASGADLRAAVENDVKIAPMSRALIPTGISIALPEGCEGQVRPRSGLAAKHGVTLLNSPGTIDRDYRGEIKVVMINLGDAEFTVSRGDRVAQLVICRTERAQFTSSESLEDTDRGSGGFGHTGA